jgi:hypothetical protein
MTSELSGQEVPPPDEDATQGIRNRWFEANLAVKIYLARMSGPVMGKSYDECLGEAICVLSQAKGHVFGGGK